MKRGNIRAFLSGVLAATLVFGLGFSALAAYQKQATLDYTGIQITLDGSKITPADANGNPVEPFAIEGTTYLPVRAIANALNLEVTWDQATQTVKLTSGEAAPSQPATPSGTYSRTTPAPIGVIQSIQVKNYSEEYNASVVVLESLRGEAAWNLILQANQFNSKPAEGKEYILAKIRVSINSTEADKAISLSDYSFEAYSSDNVEYSNAFAVTPEPKFSGKVFAGGTLEGYVVFEVSKDDKAPKISFGADYDGAGGIWFSIV